MPHSLPAEESVLGAMLVADSACDTAGQVLQAGDFYHPSHGTIFQTILALHQAGQLHDSITVIDALRKQGQLDEVGGVAAVHTLASTVPPVAFAQGHAEIVRDLSRDRQLAQAARQAYRSAMNGGVSEVEREQLRQALDRRPGGNLAADRPGRTHAEVLGMTVQAAPQLIRGLVESGTPGVIAGLPEAYKSWLALNIAHGVAGNHGLVLDRDVLRTGPVGYFWQDDSTEKEVARIKAYSGAHGLPAETPIWWHLNEGWRLPDDLPAIRELVEERHLILVVFDSLYNFTPAGLDLKAEAASDIIKAAKAELCDPTGCAALVVDHAAWPTETNTSVRAYGTVFKTAAIRWGIYLRAAESSISFQARSNNMPSTPKTPLVWDGESYQLRVIDTEQNRKAPASVIAEWVRQRPGETATPGEICDQFTIADSTLRGRRDELATLGVAYIAAGKDSRYTAAAQLPRDSADRGVSRGGDSDPAISAPSPEGGAGSRGAQRSVNRGVPSEGQLDPDDPRHPE
jgi:hypothetical protein